MKSIKTLVVAATLFFSGLAVVAVPAQVSANALEQACQADPGAAICDDQGGAGQSVEALIQTIINVLLFIIGAVAVIMIIVGGFRYVTSNGDSSALTGAKNTILYAVIGLIVAIFAYAIVNWVIGVFAPPPAP